MPHRTERVGNLIRNEICELLQRQVKDPRLSSMISITEVKVSPDLRYARVYVSCICDEAQKQEIIKALTAASGFLRRELSDRLRLRYTPELIFQWDESIEHGAHIMELIDKVCTETPEEPKSGG